LLGVAGTEKPCENSAKIFVISEIFFEVRLISIFSSLNKSTL
jgi:hypothetical protein